MSTVGATQYTFVVDKCPASYYYESSGNCVLCPKHVACDAGSTIAEWQLDPGYWRAADDSDDVRRCRFGTRSCPENGANAVGSKDPYCDPRYMGPLCSQCSSNYFMSW